MNLKTILFTALFFSFIAPVMAQQDKEPLIDPLDNKKCQIISNNKAFLIQEDSVYSFRILDITSLQSGYIFLAETTVDGYLVCVHIVTPKQSPKKKSIQTKIEIGDTIKTALRRYFPIPACVGIENVRVVDVMLANKTVPINENGDYKYLFTSFYIEGVSLLKEEDFMSKIRKIEIENNDLLKKDICTFLEYISFNKISDRTFNIIDTLQVRESLNKYGKYTVGRNPSDFDDYPEKKFEWSLDYRAKKHDWKHRDKVSPKQYHEMFWKRLGKSDLPIDLSHYNKEELYSSIQFKLLYTTDTIYTMQVIWELPGRNTPYRVVINVEKVGEDFKVVGLNKS